ncbi:hypothetical protein A7K94_0213655, partial [Modestobacter sp. VKM Ac-2676]
MPARRSRPPVIPVAEVAVRCSSWLVPRVSRMSSGTLVASGTESATAATSPASSAPAATPSSPATGSGRPAS